MQERSLREKTCVCLFGIQSGPLLVAYHNDVPQFHWIALLNCQDFSVQNWLAQIPHQRKIPMVKAQVKEETESVSSP